MTQLRLRARATLVVTSALLFAVLLTAGVVIYVRVARPALPYHDSFANAQASEWSAYDGTWQLFEGGVRNDSSEPGAKLIAGSPLWKDYTLDADVEPLGEGDAGVIVRAGNVEEGVDSYSGYYAGVRTIDQSLVLGRADHGWIEFSAQHLPGGVAPYQWYHLRVIAQGCSINVTATSIDTGRTAAVSRVDPHCLRSGMVGLRSVASGGIWKNITAATIGSVPPLAPTPAGAGTALAPTPLTSEPDAASIPPSPVQSIRSLRYLSTTLPARATVRGSVVLTLPDLYVQDSSGGTRVSTVQGTHPLKVGDGVEVTGDVYPHGLSTEMRNATVRPVWERGPIPPLAVTAGEAASGAFEAMSIQVEGRLLAKSYSEGSPLTLSLSDGQQSFLAVTDSVGAESLLHRLPLNSLLRVRGVCMVGSAYTHDQVPFLVILRSIEDARVLAGPPLLTANHIAEILALLLGLGFLLYVVYARARDWKLRMVMAERESLSHEIHDTLSQCFAGIGFQLRGVLHRLQTEPSRADLDSLREEVSVAYGFVKRSHEVARRSLGGLRPETLESTGLVPALEHSACRMVAEGSVVIETIATGDVRPVPLHVLDSLFRIGQEAIANAIQHGHPRILRITAHYAAHAIRVTIEDDGAGFRTAERSNGLGLNGMKLRTESINGRLAIRSAPGEGTRVLITAPIPRRLAWLAKLAYHKRHESGE